MGIRGLRARIGGRALPRCQYTARDVVSGLTFLGYAPVCRARHRQAPHTYQSDVESLHGLIERELFVIEPFWSRADFLAKVWTYLPAPSGAWQAGQLFFNYGRTNSYKGN